MSITDSTSTRKLKVLELFAGTRSIGKAFEANGHKVYSVEWDKKFENIDLYADISTLTAEQCLELCDGVPDVIWASPDCSSYSVAAIGYHRQKDPKTRELSPKTDYARFCDKTNSHLIDLIRELNPKCWFIENPRAGLRTMEFMKGLPRYTITYCQYGDTRQKPTDIWCNIADPQFKPACKPGSSCHQSAPRGSRTGTQGLKGSKERAVIPPEFCEYIVYLSEHPEPKDRLTFTPQTTMGRFI